MRPYEIIESPFELRILVHATSVESLFQRVLIAMFEIMKPNFTTSSYDRSHAFSINSNDTEGILVDFLSHCLYLSKVHDEAYFSLDFIRFQEQEIEVAVKGKKITGFDIEIKAVNGHGVKIQEKDGVFSTEISFDIE